MHMDDDTIPQVKPGWELGEFIDDGIEGDDECDHDQDQDQDQDQDLIDEILDDNIAYDDDYVDEIHRERGIVDSDDNCDLYSQLW